MVREELWRGPTESLVMALWQGVREPHPGKAPVHSLGTVRADDCNTRAMRAVDMTEVSRARVFTRLPKLPI